MTEENVKCPICGTKNDSEAESCKMCKTKLAKRDDGSLKVESPKAKGKTFNMIDIEDPITRKKLEELTLIPGVTRRKALFLYQSGIQSMEEFLQKAFKGERYSDNFSRTVANKLLLESLKGKKAKEQIECPECHAPNPPDAEKCAVCNFEIAKEMDAVDMGSISTELSESVSSIMAQLSESEDFEGLPEEMKAKFAALIDSDDIDFDADKPVDMEALGIDLDNIDSVGEEAVAEPVTEEEASTIVDEQAPEPDESGDSEQEQAATPEESEEPEKELTAREKKVRSILSKKVNQWRKAGYEVDDLESYYDDVEEFKVQAKKALEKGKVVKAKCQKQLDMWKEKGFDVSELEPLIEKDVVAFMDKAKDVLKGQKK